MNYFKFLKIALSDYLVVGVLMPIGKYVICRILSQFKPGYRTVVEYGAGEGVITKEILKRLPADGKIIAIELHPDLLVQLQKIDDPRLDIWTGDVLELSKSLPKSDIIISGIPFSQISREKQETIIRQTADALNKGGVFVAYQNSLLLLKTLNKFFPKTRWLFEPRNIFPYFILISKKLDL